jgi:immune inhibitor A
MRRVPAGLAGLALATGVAATVALSASAAPPDGAKTAGAPKRVVDDLPNPAEEKRRALRKVAIQQVIAGTAKVEQRGPSKVVRVGKQAVARQNGRAAAPAQDQYVELAREKTDKIFVILAEFGNEREPRYPDQDTAPNIPGPTRFDGPLHNEIPKPDRTKDNSTIWQADYNRAHFQKLYFGTGSGVESVKTYYERQSSGRYSVDGQVSDWVKVRYNEARYGRSDGYPCATSVCSNTWALIRDAIDTWVAQQKAAGRTDEQIKADLASYDQWDRNDYDADGNFNEPDGYIDHFQVVHSGGDQADGDPYQGEDAIWSHRWKAFQGTGEGPANGNTDGGTQIGTTGLWVADYTIQPENGGLSVFAHEYGHDLGLPDHYDAATDNAVNWWTLMAQSRVSKKGEQAIGTRPADLGAWDKLQLGWLDYEIVPAGTTRTLDLGPHEWNSAKAQGVVVPLGTKPVVTEFGAPFEGTKQWYSGAGDDLENTLTRQVTLPAGTATLTFQAKWNIEDCGPDPCDYAFVEVDDGSGWTAIPGSITKADEADGIDGWSNGWKPATFDLSAYAGKTIGLRLRYETDGAAQGNPDLTDEPSGIFADAFKLTSGTTTVFEDGAESGNNGWTPDGFTIKGATETVQYPHYYVASNRQYVSYDQYLQSGPYNVLNTNANPDWVEHFPYQNGLLVSYWDTSFSDNDESVHPGQGEILPIDSHPNPIYRLDGQPWRGRIQTYDAPFSLEKADSFTLHAQQTGQASYIRGQDAQPVFDDRRSYWNAVLPYVGVKVPNVGVRMRVVSASGTTMRVRIDSTKPAG